MEGYSAITSWALFGALVGAGCYYYWPRHDRQQALPRRKGRNEQEIRGAQDKRPADERTTAVLAEASDQESGTEVPRKRKAPTKKPAQPGIVPPAVIEDDERVEDDTSTRQWAEQMMQARQGSTIGTTLRKDKPIRTVKQSTAAYAPELSSESSQAGAEADDDLSPVGSPRLNAGGVSDMLEPAAAGPSIIRITAPVNPQKERVVRQPKEEIVETKKQRQNRRKKEEQSLQREAEERERKALQEKQRRTAREARGEPARNGVQSAKAPAVSVWASSGTANDALAAPSTNDGHNSQLLDTFDAESMSSSNGGLEASTAATSTTSAGAMQWDQDMPSEEDQMARAMKESEDVAGWKTVSPAKKQKKKSTPDEASVAEPAVSNRTNLSKSIPRLRAK